MSDQTAPDARPSKPMSSRLMAMKFMQRAAAASPPSLAQAQIRTSEIPPSKRQKVSTAPSWTATSSSDLQRIQMALVEEEDKREKAIERLAEDAGETNWVLSTVIGDEGNHTEGLRVARAGYSDIDQEAWTPLMVGRRSFGKFNREIERRDGAANDSPSFSEMHFEGSEDEEGKGETAGTEYLYRVSKAEKTEPVRPAKNRRSKEVRLSSISGVGRGRGNPSGISKLDMECYSCGEKGHAKRDCPQKGSERTKTGVVGPQKDLDRR